MKNNKLLTKIFAFSALGALMFSSLFAISTKSEVYADVSHNQGYFRTVSSIGQTYNLDTNAAGEQQIKSAFGYAGNRSVNIVNKDYTTNSTASEYIYFADSSSSSSPSNALVYQVIYLPDSYLQAAKNGVLSTTISANFWSPTSGSKDKADKITMTVASLSSREFSASTSMSLSSFSILNSNNVQETRTTSANSSVNLSLQSNTIGLFFQPTHTANSIRVTNTTMTFNSPKLVLHSTDTVAPSISFQPETTSYSQSRKITVIVADNGAGIKEVTLDNGTLEKVEMSADTKTAKYTFTVSDNGNYTITAIDNLGYSSTQTYTEEKIDTLAPNIALISGVESIYYTKAITFDASYEILGPSQEYFVYTLDGSAPTKDSTPIVNGENVIAVQENGAYTLKITSFDEAGNFNEIQEYNIYVDDNFYTAQTLCTEGVEISLSAQNLRYGDTYNFEYSINDGYQLYYIEINGQKIELEQNSKSFTITENLTIKVAARKIVNVWLNAESYKYTGQQLSLDFSQDYGTNDIVSFSYFLNNEETTFVNEGEYTINFIVDTEDYVGSGKFYATITNKDIGVVTLDKTIYIFDENGISIDFSSNVQESDITFTYYLNGEISTPKTVGTYTLKYEINTDSHEGSGVLSFEIIKKEITISVFNSNFVYDETEKTLVYSNEKNAEMILTITQNGNSVKPVNAGIYDYNIEIRDNSYCGNVSGQFEISKASVEINVDDTEFVYDGNEKNLIISVEKSLPYSLVITKNSEISSIISAGEYSYTITVNQPNYFSEKIGNFIVAKRDINVAATSFSIVYGDTIPTFTYTITNAVRNDNLVFEIAQITNVKNVGIYEISIIPTNYDNYNIEYTTGTLVINAKQLDITISADNFKIYGETDPQIKFTYDQTDIVLGDEVAFEIKREQGEDVGTYKINDIEINNPNYELNIVTYPFKIIKKKIAVKSINNSKIYGEIDPTLSYEIVYSSLCNDDTLSGNLEREQGENVGEYAISIGTLNNPNYEILFVSGSFEIAPKTLRIFADNITNIYGEPDKALTYTTDGLLDGDTLSGTLIRQSGINVGEYQILIGSLQNSNYNIEFTPAIYNIQKRTIFVSANNLSKIYGEDDVVLTYNIENLAYDDNVELTLVREVGENVGQYNISLENVVLENYEIDFVSAVFAINKKPIEITITAGQSKIYGQPDTAILYYVSDNETVDDLVVAREVGENAGLYAINVVSTELKNHIITSITTANYEIKKADVQITLNSETVIFDGLVHSLEINESYEVTYSYKQHGIDVELPINAGEYTVVATYQGDENHNVSYSNEATLTIQKQQVYISVENDSFVYDGKAKLPVYNTNIECNSIVEMEQLNIIDVGEYNYKIVVNEDNYYGETSGVMTIYPKQVFTDNSNNEIVDEEGDLIMNNVTIVLNEDTDKQTLSNINKSLSKKQAVTSYNFVVNGNLPENTKVVVKLDATDIENISEYSVYFYNSNYEMKEVGYTIENGKIVFEATDLSLKIAVTKTASGSSLLLFALGLAVILIVIVTATVAIKIYKFIRVRSIINASGEEEVVPFFQKNKNKKINKIMKKLDDND